MSFYLSLAEVFIYLFILVDNLAYVTSLKWSRLKGLYRRFFFVDFDKLILKVDYEHVNFCFEYLKLFLDC